MENNYSDFHLDMPFKFSGKFSSIFLTIFQLNKVTHTTADFTHFTECRRDQGLNWWQFKLLVKAVKYSDWKEDISPILTFLMATSGSKCKRAGGSKL